MSESVETTVRAIWSLLVRVVFLISGIYLLVRFGPQIVHRLEPVLLCVVASVALTYILLPSIEWLCSKRSRYVGPKFQRLLATTFVFLVFLGLVALSVFLFVTPFQREINQFSENITDYTGQLSELFESASAWYRDQVPEQVRSLIGKLDYNRLLVGISDSMQRLLRVATSSVGFVLELLLIPVLAFYFALDYKPISRDFYSLFPPHRRREAIRIGRGIGGILQSYIFGQLILCVIAGVVTGAFLAALDMPYVVVLALFACITRAIPVVGPVLSGVPIVLVGLLNSHGSFALPVELAVFTIILHFVESKFIMPKLIGYRLHLHPATILVVLLVGAEFLGLVGMFLAAPIAAVIRELVRFYYVRPIRTKRKPEPEEVEQPLFTKRSA